MEMLLLFRVYHIGLNICIVLLIARKCVRFVIYNGTNYKYKICSVVVQFKIFNLKLPLNCTIYEMLMKFNVLRFRGITVAIIKGAFIIRLLHLLLKNPPILRRDYKLIIIHLVVVGFRLWINFIKVFNSNFFLKRDIT